MSDRLSFEEAARELGISESELEQLVADGQVASVKEGDSLFVTRDAVDTYKSEPQVLLSDSELDFLEDDGDIDFDIDIEAPTETVGDDGTDELSVGDLGASDPEETVVSMDLLEDDATTPVAGGGLLEDDDTLGDDTLLDTDVLDLGDDETDTFDLDTAEETLLDPVEEGALLRGGGARVMQMKRKAGHPLATTGLVVTALILLVPFSVLLSMIYLSTMDESSIASGGKEAFGWIKDHNYLSIVVDKLAALFE